MCHHIYFYNKVFKRNFHGKHIHVCMFYIDLNLCTCVYDFDGDLRKRRK